MAPEETDPELARLRQEHATAWHVWRSDEGHWYASRRHELPQVAKGAGHHGVFPNVHGETAAELEERLREQAYAMDVVERVAAVYQ